MEQETKIFKALAEETRLRILALLLEGELCVCEIIAALELPQSTISRHLAYLRNHGWIRDRRQGAWMYYRMTGDDNALIGGLKPLLKQHIATGPENVEALMRLRVFQRQQQKPAC